MEVLQASLPEATTLAAWLVARVGDHAWMHDATTLSGFCEFLSTTIVALATPGSSLQKTAWASTVHCTHVELVDQAIGIALQRKLRDWKKHPNLITLGFTSGYECDANHFTLHAHNVMHHSPNSLVSLLKSKNWAHLHSHLGDACMLHLLVDHVLCVRIASESDNYIQLAGPPLPRPIPLAKRGTVVGLMPSLYYKSNRPHTAKTFRKTHVLYLAPPQTASSGKATRLVQSIFSLAPTKRGRSRLPPLLRAWVPWVQTMLRNFQGLNVERTIARACPLSQACQFQMRLCLGKQSSRVIGNGYASQDDDEVSSESDDVELDDVDEPPPKRQKLVHQADIHDLLQFATPKEKVLKSIRAITAQIVPIEMWGPRKNYQCVVRLFHDYIGGRCFDTHSIEQTVSRMSVQRIPWMSAQSTALTEMAKRRHHLVQFLHWMWCELVQPILRANFYITTKEGQFYDVLYYRRPLWDAISQLASRDLQRHLLRPIATPTTRVAKVRFVPKAHGVRPIVNLSKRLPFKKSTNDRLRGALRVLKHEISLRQRLLGASTTNTDAMLVKLTAFKAQWAATGQPRVYFVTLDIERCFDTMKPKRLLQLLPSLLTQESYLVRHYHVVCGDRSRAEHPVVAVGDYTRFEHLIASRDQNRNTVYVDGVVYDVISRADILSLLKTHLLEHDVRIGRQAYRQVEGIPQGSVLSSLLCNLYYADFEKQVLHGQLRLTKNDLLLRYTDDFCFLTTSRVQATTFLRLMIKGSRAFGCSTNAAKTLTNVDGIDAPLLKWCNLVIDPATLHIHANYTKLLRAGPTTPAPLQHALALPRHKPLRDWFIRRVVSTSIDKCHAIFFGGRLNPRAAIEVNAYQLLRVIAAKAMYLVRARRVRNMSYVALRLDATWKLVYRTIQRATRGDCPLTLLDIRHIGFATAMDASAACPYAHALTPLLQRRARRLSSTSIDLTALRTDPRNAFATRL